MPDTLVVIPVFNHGATLRSVVTGALSFHRDVLVVDDGSTDNGVEAIRDLPVRVVQHESNRGKGQAILTAAAEAQRLGKTHIITMDADGQHYPEDIPAFVQAVKACPRGVIVGSRRFTGDHVPGASKFGRAFSNFWLRVQTGKELSDVQCGFRAYPVALFQAVRLHEKRYAMEVEVLVKASWAGFPLQDLPIDVHYPPPEERVSHFKALRDNIQISLLNTRLTARCFLPVPHRQYAEDRDGKVSPVHPIRSLKLLLLQKESPLMLALAGALGMLLGTLAIPGLHCIAIILVAGYFGLSRITALAVSQLCMPPIVPALCIEAGYYLRHGELLTDISLQTLGYEALDRIWEWILGSLALAPLFGLAMGLVVYVMALLVRVQLQRREQNRRPAMGDAHDR
ncbi:DUF2062 domain-containing protein [Salidesulfovibrio onnuriiensis]|uniref:DUF2062 domain-containing protein n=1 Tax=Salidesulfovibrio onnuriiensis TaxID=2583823 RepID=UPI00202AD097|nr:DUF2062 domain-containing protein [Salidesulfovibrio onnuriiensis]